MGYSSNWGEYIHYNYENYKRYGLGKTEGDRSAPWAASNFDNFTNQIHSQILTIAKKKSTVKRVAELEAALNYFATNSGKTLDAEVTQEQIKALEQVLELWWSKKGWRALEVNFNKATGTLEQYQGVDIQKAKSVARSKAGTRKATDNNTGDPRFSLKTLLARYGNTKKVVQQAIQRTNLNSDKKNELLVKLKNLKQEWKTLSNQLELKGKQHGYIQSTPELMNFQQHMVELARLCQCLQAETLFEGVLGEGIVAASSMLANGKVDRTVDELVTDLSNSVIGDQRNSAGINGMRIGRIASHIMKDNMKEHTSYHQTGSVAENNLRYETKTATQNKVDVMLDIGGVSVKNYNFIASKKYGVSLVSDAKLSDILLQYPDFANHYANVTGWNLSHKTDSLTFAANKAAKSLILLTAFSGMQGKDSVFAQFFVINDKVTGKWRVFFISDLIERIMKDWTNTLAEITVGDNVFHDTTLWNNQWVESKKRPGHNDMFAANMRINNILNQWWQNTKVKMSFDTFAN